MKNLKGLYLSIFLSLYSLVSSAVEPNSQTPSSTSSTAFSRYSTIPTVSIELPQYLTQYLNKNQLQQVVKELNLIKVYSPEQFFVSLRNNITTVLSTGKDSLILKTDMKVTKVSLYGLHKDPFWNLLLKTTTPDVRLSYALQTSNDATKIQREIIGQIIWRTYDPLTSPIWAISSDLQALQRDYEYGRSLQEVMANPLLYARYDKTELWKEIIRIQNLAERMLLETGLSIDLRSPTNFIVMGDKISLRLSNIDYELMLPNSATRAYYRRQGQRIPQIQIPRFSHRVSAGFYRTSPRTVDLNLKFPNALLVPSAILTSSEWNLTPEQALDYLQVKQNISRSTAQSILQMLPKYKNAQLKRVGRCVGFLN